MKKIAFITTLFSMSVSGIHSMNTGNPFSSDRGNFIHRNLRIIIPIDPIDEGMSLEESPQPYPFVINCPAPNKEKRTPIRKKYGFPIQHTISAAEKDNISEKDNILNLKADIEDLEEELSMIRQIQEGTQEIHIITIERIKELETEIKNLKERYSHELNTKKNISNLKRRIKSKNSKKHPK